MEEWLLVAEDKNSPAYNMACDEFLLSLAESYLQAILRIYSWDRKAYSIGYIQEFEKLGLDKNLPFIRRMTGGGVVEHTELTLTYSIALPHSHYVCKDLDRLESYHFFHHIVAKCLQKSVSLYNGSLSSYVDRKTMNCFESSTRYDIVLNDSKVAGSAQRRTEIGLLHQGVIKLSSVQEREVLKNSFAKNFSSHIPCSFKRLLFDKKMKDKVFDIKRHKYSTREWNQKK